MSSETEKWLNTMILCGFTDKRGNAWHYRKDLQGIEPNHYAGSIPVDDVLRRLFNFTVDAQPLYIQTPQGLVEIPGRKAMVASDNSDVLGIFKSGYQGHQYQEWLLDNVATIINDSTGLAIGSAGLLRNRGVAFVQVELPDSIKTPEGVEFRPNLVATTSFDGTSASIYKRTNTIVVCDNTRETALHEVGQQFKCKHTKHSGYKIKDARQALELIMVEAEEFAAEITTLCQWQVSDAQFKAFLDKLVPMEDGDSKRAVTMAVNKRNALDDLYFKDERASTWHGNAFGVLQAVNTYNQHEGIIRGTDNRAVRNMENVISGKIASADIDALKMLEFVTA